MTDLPLTVQIAGAGPLEPVLRDAAATAGLADSVTWHGSLPNREVGGLLASCDLLVLPSRFDGWGVVVNESLSAGTPVVCSDACGAADLLASPQLGHTFRSGDVNSLAHAIRRQFAQGRPPRNTRELIQQRAGGFSPGSVATYFVDVMRAVHDHTDPPRPPWRCAA